MISANLPIYIGLPAWQNKLWPAWLQHSQPLTVYSQFFNCIEGNTSFWQIPSQQRVAQWYSQTPSHFRFCLKLPKALSHTSLADQETLLAFLGVLDGLADKAGMSFLQLPESFGPNQLNDLAKFLNQWPASKPLAIEVRHRAWHDRSDAERALNRLLKTQGIERVGFDTRYLFRREHEWAQLAPQRSAGINEALQRKPRVPVKLAGLTSTPMMRVLACNHQSDRQQAFLQWGDKLSQWQRQGKRPYLFFHSPDLQDAPSFCQEFLATCYPDIKWPLQPSQQTLGW